MTGFEEGDWPERYIAAYDRVVAEG